jgi:hypothetical protein
LITLVKVWNPATWELSDPKEVYITKSSTFEEFGDKIAEAFNIPAELINIARINYYWNFTRA